MREGQREWVFVSPARFRYVERSFMSAFCAARESLRGERHERAEGQREEADWWKVAAKTVAPSASCHATVRSCVRLNTSSVRRRRRARIQSLSLSSTIASRPAPDDGCPHVHELPAS